MTTDSCRKDMSKYCFRDRDEFRREPIAEKIIALLKNEHADISPLLIDGDWGTGKTEFCHKLINKLKEEVRQQEPHQANTESAVEDAARGEGDSLQPYFKVAYIDAFRADHTGEPLMAIFAAVSKALVPQGEEEKSEKREDFVKAIAKIMLLVLKHGGKAILSHVLKANVDELGKELTGALENAGSEIIDTSFASMLKAYEDIEENLEALRKLLTELAQDTPLVIFIDELDRCKPNFAVQLVEIIKHIFDVPHIQFVLVTNRSQLHAAIEHCYGPKIQADRYLDKFIKFSLTLPRCTTSSGRDFDDVSVIHFTKLFSEAFSNIHHADTTKILNIATGIIKQKKLTLREVESFYRYINIYNTIDHMFLTRDTTYLTFGMLSIAIYCFDRDLVTKITDGTVTAHDLASAFSINKDTVIAESSDIEIAVICILQELPNSEKYDASQFTRDTDWVSCFIDTHRRGFFSAKNFSEAFNKLINTMTFRQSF